MIRFLKTRMRAAMPAHQPGRRRPGFMSARPAGESRMRKIRELLYPKLCAITSPATGKNA